MVARRRAVIFLFGKDGLNKNGNSGCKFKSDAGVSDTVFTTHNFGQRHDLKAAGVRNDGAAPVHIFLIPPKLLMTFLPGLESR